MMCFETVHDCFQNNIIWRAYILGTVLKCRETFVLLAEISIAREELLIPTFSFIKKISSLSVIEVSQVRYAQISSMPNKSANA